MIDEKRFTKTAVRETTHNLIMENRRKLSVSGVEDVDSFDEESIILYTEAGLLTVKGSELHINKLSVESGEVAIEGEIDSVVYSDADSSKGHGMGLLGKLFK